ncbi:AraC family transcriptional regulator [Enterococcus gilvus]|uniref:HTH araC/xylS-type domain-containing protein n=1 Tax=Enterococcus gilvus ATCC BAA-350 TaxID=1158614 RepID=R2VCQ0_9ENTE|nr:AraC family transcriptional regulator [Enterococcus gilvus]EOI55465.1 hypothetical protein UKC_02673 [Enterococcus gilvus ATCC BAA-350]EOW81992.1 hypothetical protein I592_01293 [Enterococcus gilvus ATCC BAA-350]OJG43021.1 hypothetical protein RV02_GL002941 [Enterococcus gilvus]
MRLFFNNHNFNDQIYLYTVGYDETLPSHKYGPTTRSGYMLHYVYSGEGCFSSEGRHYSLKKGDFFFIKPDNIVSYQASKDNPWTYYSIGFRGDLVKSYLERTAINSYHPIFSIYDGGDIIKDKISEIFEISLISEHNDLLLNAKLLEIFFYLSERYPVEKGKIAPTKNVLLTKALQLMRNNLEDNLRINEIAESLNIDRSYLHRIFKDYFNLSPKEYLTTLRLNKAKELLVQSDYPINVVSQSVGIEDAQNFSKLFKAKEGLSPREYRKQNK